MLRCRCMVRVVATSNPPKAIMGFHFHSFSLSFFFPFRCFGGFVSPLRTTPHPPYRSTAQCEYVGTHIHVHTYGAIWVSAADNACSLAATKSFAQNTHITDGRPPFPATTQPPHPPFSFPLPTSSSIHRIEATLSRGLATPTWLVYLAGSP